MIERLSAEGRLGVSALAAELDVSKGIVHNHLSTLRELGYVRKIGEEYELTPKFLTLGLQARSNTNFYRVANNLAEEFAIRFDLGVALFQRTNPSCTVIESYRSPVALDLQIGTAIPLHESVVGLVILAADGGDVNTVATEYNAAGLADDVRERGYAIAPFTPGTGRRCIALPVKTDGGDCQAAIGVFPPEEVPNQRTERITERAVNLRENVEARFESDWTGERSFATEKHTWIGG